MADPITAAVSAIVAVGKYVAGSFAAVSAGTATTAQIATVIGANVALSVGGQLLLAPRVNGYGGSPSEWRADPDAGLPFVLGEFGLAGNIVYREAYGPDNRFQSLVTVYTANGPVHEWGAFTADDIALTFGANDAAVTGPSLWQGNVYRQLRDGTASDAALSSPAGLEGGASLPGWGAAYRLPGLASSMITMRGDKKNKRFPSGEISPFQRLKAPKWSYDPRLDSTYPGGSGSHRRNDRTSWGYSDNPYILDLNFALGYWTGNGGFGDGKLIGGFGNDWDNVDVASYVEGANIADANGWRVGGMFRSTDSKHEVHRAILQAGGGIYANPNGKTGCVCRGAVRASLLDVTYADIAGDIELSADIPFTDKINSVIPRAPLPAFKFELDALQEVVVDDYVTADGGLRQRRVDMPMVPDPVQAAQLAAYAIVNSRERVSGRVPMMPWMRELRPGDCFTFQTPGLNLDGVKVMVLDREWDADRQIITITFQSETDSKHAFALGQDPDPPAPTGLTVGNPFEVPAPDGTQWTATGGVIGTPGGVTQPGIDLVGGNEPNMVSGVWIEYRRGTSGDWTTWFKGEAGEADYQIAGLVAGADDYYVSIRYANQLGVWNEDDDRLIIGPLTTGSLTSGDTLAVGGRAASQLLAEIDEALEDAETALADAEQVARDLRRELDIEFSLLISGIARLEDQTSRDGTDSYRRLERVRVTSEGAQATADSILNLTASPSSALITKLDLFEAQFAGTDPSGLLTNINTRATITQLNQAVADIFGASVSSFTDIAAEFGAVDARLDTAETDILARATISQLNEAEAKADIANARAIQRLESSLAEAVGIFLSSIETTAREDEASARIVQRVSAQTDQNTAAAQLFLSAYTDGAGNALAVGGITLDVNGRITGFRLFSDGDTGEADFAVDKIKVNGITLFSAAGGGLLTSDTIRARLLEAVSDGDDAIAIEPGKPWLLWAGDKTIAAGDRTIANARTALTDDGGLYLGQQKYERTTTQNVDQTGSNWRVIARLDLTGIKENAVFSFAGTRLVFVDPPLSGSPADGNYQYTVRAHIQNRTFEDYAIGSVQTPPSTADSSFLAEGDVVAAVFSGDQTIIDNFQTQIARSGVRQLFLGSDTNTVYIYAQRSGTPHTETLRIASGTRIVAAPIINQDIF